MSSSDLGPSWITHLSRIYTVLCYKKYSGKGKRFLCHTHLCAHNSSEISEKQKANGRPPISWRADPKHYLPELLLLSGMIMGPSCTPSCAESSDGSALGDISDITATAKTPATPAMHPPIKLSIFPILSSLGIISSVIEGLPHNFEHRDRDRYGWSPTHTIFPPLL